MKTITYSLLSAIALVSLSSSIHAGPSFQQSQIIGRIQAEHRVEAAGLVPLGEQDSAWAAKALADYPLQTCVVSGDPLSAAHGAYDFAYVQPGAAPRLVRFSSLESADQFVKDPAQYLKRLDDAAKTRSYARS